MSSCEGAKYLFCNDYEHGLLLQKTGWTDAELRSRIGTLSPPWAARAFGFSRKDGPDVEVPVVAGIPKADPTGVGDAFRAGFLGGLTWGFTRRALRSGRQPAGHLGAGDRRHAGVHRRRRGFRAFPGRVRRRALPTRLPPHICAVGRFQLAQAAPGSGRATPVAAASLALVGRARASGTRPARPRRLPDRPPAR